MKVRSCGVFLKFFVVVLCACLLMGLVPVLGSPSIGQRPSPPPSIEYSDEVVHIRTAVELAGIGGSGYVYKTYVLDNDIDLVDEWVPIMDFRGTFDGQGHSINNLYVLKSSNRQYAGLFGSVYDNVAIKNVGVNINSKGITAYNFYSFNAAYDLDRAEYYVVAGGLIGHSSSVTIENCYVTGDITATAKGERIAVAGGLVGYCSNVTIKNCYITSDVTASSMRAYAGGSIGYGYNAYGSTDVATIKDSYATGNILATSATYDARPTVAEIRGYPRGNSRAPADDTFAGGLVGYHRYNVFVENCYTAGNITATAKSDGAFAGGLVGSSYGVTVANSYATGGIIAKTKSTACAGGLVGNGDRVTVMNSYATGGIIVSSDSYTIAGMYSAAACGGGLIGRGDNITVMNSYVTCDVTVTATSISARAGGLIGWGSIAVTAVNCYAIGGVIATITTNRDSSFVGGLVGYMVDDVVVSCYSLSTQKITGGKVNEVGTVLTSEEMKNQRSFTGWDFKTVWTIDPNINEGYPYLTMNSSIESTPNDTWGLFGSFWFFILFVVVVLGVVGVVYVFLEKKIR